MAITRRVIQTVTEDFDSGTSYDGHGTEASQESSDLLDVKRKSTLGDFQDNDSNASPLKNQSSKTDNSLSPFEFSLSVKNWIGHHIIGFCIAFFTLLGSTYGLIWAGGIKLGGIEKDIETLKLDLNEVKMDSKETTKTIQRIESAIHKPKTAK